MKSNRPDRASGEYSPVVAGRVAYLCGTTLLTLSLSGCAVMLWPHHEQRLPTTSGRVVEADVPVAGARVYLLPALDRGGCRESGHMAITDAEGRFEITGDRALTWLLVRGDRRVSWGLCIRRDGVMTEGWRAHDLGFRPRRAEVVCDLGGQPQERVTGEGVCKVTEH